MTECLFTLIVGIFSQMNPIDEVEAATASITQQSSEEEAENIVNSVTLEHCAEEILSGIKKEVEVQYLVPMMVSSNEHESTQSNQQTQGLHYPVKESGTLISQTSSSKHCMRKKFNFECHWSVSQMYLYRFP